MSASQVNLALGIMTALFVRGRTGRGQKVEVSLLGSQIALQAPEIQHYLHFGSEHEKEFRASPTIGHYECSDGAWVMVVAIDEKFWPRLTAALGLEAASDDPRFSSGFRRFSNRAELQSILEGAFRGRPSQDWLERLHAHDVPASLVFDYAELTTQEQPWVNGYFTRQDHPRFGEQAVVGLHIQLSETPGAVSPAAPELGQHTAQVLTELGLSASDIASLRAAGAIGA